MFTSEWGRKTFVKIMLFSWAGMLLPWFSSKGYDWRIHISPFFIVQAALLFVLCKNEPKRKVWKIIFPVFTEALLISVPAIYFWPMMICYYIIVTHENYVSTGQITTYSLFWIALTFIPILAFPILRRWKKDEVK